MEAVFSSETPVKFHRAAVRNMSKGNTIHLVSYINELVGRLVFGGRAWRTISKYSPAFAYGG
jgi:hypothetical protein